jgi:hypothetical protein
LLAVELPSKNPDGDDEVVRTKIAAVCGIGRRPGKGVGPTNFVVFVKLTLCS